MRKEMVIFLIVFSVFLAIGCAGNNGEEAATPNETAAEMPAEAPNETTTEMPAETPDETMEEIKTVEVTIDNSAFDPDSVTIFSGDTVRWTNKDSTTHTVDGSTFSSGHLNKGDTFEFTFTEPGTYDYRCKIHPTEQGVVIVE